MKTHVHVHVHDVYAPGKNPASHQHRGGHHFTYHAGGYVVGRGKHDTLMEAHRSAQKQHGSMAYARQSKTGENSSGWRIQTRSSTDAYATVHNAYAPGKNPASHQHHSMGTHVKINAPGVRGHGQSGYVVNHAEKAGGRHFVGAPPSEAGNYGPFHAHQLRPIGKAPKAESGPERMDPRWSAK